MCRHQRVIVACAVLASGFLLAGCETSDLMDKVQDMIPFGDNKKPLPGERKEVFPQGVPGVPQGVPPDMVKGAQAQQPAPPPEAAAPPPEQPKQKKAAVKKRPPQPAAAAEPPPTQSATVQPAPQSAWPPPMQPANSPVAPYPAPPSR